MCAPEPEDPPELHWLVPTTPSDRKDESVQQCYSESATAAIEKSYVGNSTNYRVECLEWLETH